MAGAIGRPAEAVDDVSEVTRDQHIALDIVRKVRRLGELDDHRFDLSLADGHPAAPLAADELGLHHAWQQFGDARAVALDEGLAPVAKGDPPRVAAAGGAPVGMELEAFWAQSPRAVLIKPADAPRRLDAREGVQTLTEQQLAARAPGEGVDVLVGVACAETGEQHASDIGLVVAISVREV